MGTIDSERTKLAAEEAAAKYKQLLAEVKFVEAGYASQVRNAELELKQAQLELKRAETNADRMLVKAPIAGLVVMQTTLRGTELQQIQAGDQLFPGMRFMQIVDTSSMVVNATVNQVDADTLRVGAKATVRFDAFPGLELPAHVHAIGAMTRQGGFRASYVKDIPLILKLDKLDGRVIPDLSVSVDVELERGEQQATLVPIASVFEDAAGEGTYVFVQKGEGWERRPVQLGIADNLTVAVKSGIRAGEVVALDRPPEGIQKAGR
jgi:multidrug efflux pump subunit AcrA (membrane-fusion protein)